MTDAPAADAGAALDDDPRTARRVPEAIDEYQRRERNPEYRVDVERIRFSPYYSRLSAVTQVIAQAGAGLAVHNRLTHSVKVAAVARGIAVQLSHSAGPEGEIVARLGGCDPVVVQAAAAAHDLGHPPFGHLGEQALDRLARDRFGLRDGFEGNAQTFRIVTRLDEYDRAGAGLNLTAAVRAAVLKYPWLRAEGDGWSGRPEAPRGITPASPGSGAYKFSAFALDAHEMRAARAPYPAIAPLQQTMECSVMDIADDIAYSLHDLDDFYRAGLLNQSTISAEFRAWRRDRAALHAAAQGDLVLSQRTPGRSLELLWRRLEAKDPWIADEEVFAAAVARVTDEVIDGLLAVPFDGSMLTERTLSQFTAAWITRLQHSVTVSETPPIRSGHVSLDRDAWHEVAVLKFLHQRFILERPDLALYQRGQASVLERLVDGFAAWLDDPHDVRRAPRRLLDLVDLAAEDYARLRRDEPELADASDGVELRRRATGRGIIDYVASLTDAQAMHIDALINGSPERLWDAGQGL
ncbi:dNTP triphosphohydrolase [Microbacterium oryzae]|uniref:deoxyguanosinetriphosphate triphosphohydrolase family protein n=1 Tax=Microbacterium oryzae TaxID=743009 RepID=UPI0025B028FC|nr:dNTP triphosphohydrolase [Microbacterium oryzae]MDN3309368.1 dNTP triphosphohydrolase [Microbacterium oryzae]